MPGEDEAWRRAEQAPHPGSTIPTPGGTYVPEYRPQPPSTPTGVPGGGMGQYADGAAQAIRDAANRYAAQRSSGIAQAAANAIRDAQRYVVHGSTGPAMKPYQPFTPGHSSAPVYLPTWHPPMGAWPHNPTVPGSNPSPFWPTYPPGRTAPPPRDPRKGLPPPPARVDAQGFYVIPQPPKVDAEGFYAIALPPGGTGTRKAKVGFLFGLGGLVVDDATLTSTFGNEPIPRERGYGRQRVDAFDADLQNPDLASLIERIAAEVEIDPGLLAVVALHELWGGGLLTSKTGVINVAVGVDHWETEAAAVVKDVPAAKRIQWRPASEAWRKSHGLKPGEKYVQETGKTAGDYIGFKTGEDSFLALAGVLKHREKELERSVGTEKWNGIPVGERFALVRLSFNPGENNVNQLAQRAANGKSILITSGPVYGSPATATNFHPLRYATQAAGQAIHISQHTFGNLEFAGQPLTN
jgi:hypothetical protein